MPIRSPELNVTRREEIMAACLKLYQEKSFRDIAMRDIAMRDIAEAITFSRSSIYNYFETKEEIFLALCQQEYERWTADLKEIIQKNDTLDVADFASAVAKTVEKRTLLLKLLSMNMYDMEDYSRMEQLTEFKRVYNASMDMLTKGLKKFFPTLTTGQEQSFLRYFMPFMYGVYPYTFITDKQTAAMERAEMTFQPLTVYELTRGMIEGLLKTFENEVPK